MNNKVYICSPLGGDVAANIEKVKRYARYALKLCGAAPVVPHNFNALLLDDNNPQDRELGMKAGKDLLWFCDELWVFGDKITEGMDAEIRYCKNLNIRVRYISETDVNLREK